MSAISLLPACLTHWSRNYTTRVDPHVDNSHQVWSWYDHPLLRYSVFVCWYVTWPCDLDLSPFDLKQLTYMAGHVTNLATKIEDPMPIRSWVMSNNVCVRILNGIHGYHWECVRGHCARARAESRDPWIMVKKQLYFWNHRQRFAYTTLIVLRRRLRVVYSRASPMVKPLTA